METVFVITDLLQPANNALRYSIGLAEHLNARVFVMHVDLDETGDERSPGQENLFSLNTDHTITAAEHKAVVVEQMIVPQHWRKVLLNELKARKPLLVVAEAGREYAHAANGWVSKLGDAVNECPVPMLLVTDTCTFSANIEVGFIKHLSAAEGYFDPGLLLSMGIPLKWRMHLLTVTGSSIAAVDQASKGLKLRSQLKDLHPTLTHLQTVCDKSVKEWQTKFEVELIAFVKNDLERKELWEDGVWSQIFLTGLPLLMLPAQFTISPKKEPCKKDSNCKSCPDCKLRHLQTDALAGMPKG